MKTVMIFGTFDIVHHGHLKLFQNAKKYGDRLIAVISRESRAETIKQKKLVHTEQERKDFLKAIRFIDDVVLGGKTDVYLVIKKWKPDVIVLGYDQNHFVEGLEKKIKEFHLKTKIIRAKPYRQDNLKTQTIRNLLEKNV